MGAVQSQSQRAGGHYSLPGAVNNHQAPTSTYDLGPPFLKYASPQSGGTQPLFGSFPGSAAASGSIVLTSAANTDPVSSERGLKSTVSTVSGEQAGLKNTASVDQEGISQEDITTT